MTTSADKLVQRVRAADPLDPDDLRAWTASQHRERIVRDIIATPVGPARRSHRRRAGVVAIVVAGVLVGAAAATATTILGRPAPDPVRAHLAKLDRGMPPDLRYNPDLANARAVAATASGTLYAADLRNGGYCIEVASPTSQPRGGTCLTTADASAHPIEVIAPIPTGDDAPLLIGGRLNTADLAALQVTYTGTAPNRVALGLDRYFLIEVPAAQQAAALDDGIDLTALDSHGQVAAHVQVPPLRDNDGEKLDRRQPIFVSTLSDSHDFTLVLGIEGRVNVTGYHTLELTYPDGTVVTIPTKPDGTYRFALPADRRGDFARAFGVLTARDTTGGTIATAPVASVAAWRARNR